MTELESARAWAVALEQRLAEVREAVVASRDLGENRLQLSNRLLLLIDAELGVA